jgi:hypothetical protein
MKNSLSLLAISLLSMSVQAGRPMSVDDANVNDKGVAHVESFWSRAAKPLVGVGLRKDVLPGLQLDGTWGKQGGMSVFSLGTKYTF